ncbi:Hypothetical protein R9X50_00373100 [Acrodontium crateriforme]|uniref:Uncharacterized protein n=1 Tax=Acrodontium crateriforme TaxID=150365 RepID=A0AAQ3M324_9PEZI|nr:Hypothetical protein R9X50_00373100 [Acrodontium crateriforme]
MSRVDYTTAVKVLSDVEKNRLLCCYLNSTDIHAVDWDKAASEFGSASKESFKRMITNSFKKVRDLDGASADVLAAATVGGGGGGARKTTPKTTPKATSRKRNISADDDEEGVMPTSKKCRRKTQAKSEGKVEKPTDSDDDVCIKGEDF